MLQPTGFPHLPHSQEGYGVVIMLRCRSIYIPPALETHPDRLYLGISRGPAEFLVYSDARLASHRSQLVLPVAASKRNDANGIAYQGHIEDLDVLAPQGGPHV
jgi:hypothetical protein